MYFANTDKGDECLMRIVAGKYGSRPLKACKGDTTRPTADKVKGAIFSSLGGSFDSGKMLDCYSGTGNMALEALSRGMKFATMVEKDRMALNVIRENVRSLQEKNCEIISGNIFSVIHRLKEVYDLVYIDPPYKEEKNVELIEKLDQLSLINTNGMVVVESLAQQTFPEQIATLVKQKEKVYGITKITYYRKQEKE